MKYLPSLDFLFELSMLVAFLGRKNMLTPVDSCAFSSILLESAPVSGIVGGVFAVACLSGFLVSSRLGATSMADFSARLLRHSIASTASSCATIAAQLMRRSVENKSTSFVSDRDYLKVLVESSIFPLAVGCASIGYGILKKCQGTESLVSSSNWMRYGVTWMLGGAIPLIAQGVLLRECKG